ncbi:MAG TPA: acetate kinase [Jiangellaceae bacterium]|nr:acetate kinase [Jiangellaceae bacterium]
MSRMVLVLNCGSSSIKYQLVDVDDGGAAARGLVERIGEQAGHIRHEGPDGDVDRDQNVPDHEAGLSAVLAALAETGATVTDSGVHAVGHRVVHGGDRFAEPALITDDVVETIEALSDLAPLHNPANLAGIRVARAALPDTAHVAVFDTAFHQTLPPHAFTYAVPEVWRSTHGVRRYGFHGTSVEYVAGKAAETLGRDAADCNLVVLHLGNGASATAVAGGRSVDTSMGLTPLEGLVMGTRSGDLDPAVVAYLIRVAGLSAEDVDDQLNRHSGLSALAGANDMREVHRRADAGDVAALLALEVYCYRIRKYIGAYHAVLGRLDAVVFTAGVGENDPDVRARAVAGLESMGIAVDPVRNVSPDRDARDISTDQAAVAVLVIPTNEELEIARQTLAVATRPSRTATSS